MTGRKAAGTAGPPVVLTIAGSDNSAGAGMQADLRAIRALGGFGLTAVTCVVAEVPGRVEAVQEIDTRIVRDQIRLSLEAFPVEAIKTGMLFSAAIVESVAEMLGPVVQGGVPLVIDPVMVASSGDLLLQDDAVSALCNRLFPLASVVTPNVGELAFLTHREIRDEASLLECGRLAVEKWKVPFLLKGGHLGGSVARDILVGHPDGQKTFEAPFEKGVDPHGTGCTYSAAIATGLASGLSLVDAVASAKQFITQAIQNRWTWGQTEALAF